MSPTTVSDLSLPGVFLLRPETFRDDRGSLQVTWSRAGFAAIGIDIDFVQENQSHSLRRGTVRGLHFQRPPHAQAKLVRVAAGAVFDVAVDLRRSSPTFGRWCAATLTAAGGEQMLVPAGLAHGFCTLADDTVVAYRLSQTYSRPDEAGVLWNDPALGISWPVAETEAVLSDRDRALPPLGHIEPPFA